MKPFRTIVAPHKPGFRLSHTDNMLSVGSCFSENIGQLFRQYKFNININPFGQQYNPHSIAQGLERLLNPAPFTSADLIQHNGLYHSLSHHGSFSKTTAEQTLHEINERLHTASEQLKTATILFITLGTAHVFKWKESGKVVSNCHQLPGNLFERELMPPTEIEFVLQNALTQLRSINTGIKIVLTVSPVRYFAFGAYENTVSKSHLFNSIYSLQKHNPDWYYFPAYELVIDDLRDYRFFSDDMLHPNAQAIDYVWNSLCQTMLSAETLTLLPKIDEILQALNHRPRNPGGLEHKKFLEKLLEKTSALTRQAGLDFTVEYEKINTALQNC